MRDNIPLLTPDKTLLTFPIASVLTRMVAFFVDILLYLAFMLGLSAFGTSLFLTIFGPFGQVILTIFSAIAVFLYFILFEGFWNGTTLGKRIFLLRVVMADGTPITWRSAMLRNLMRLGDLLPIPFLPALILMTVSRNQQRIGDMVANTVVVCEPNTRFQFTPSPHRVGIHPLEHHIGSLRTMTMQEYLAVKKLCDRFPQLPTFTQNRLTEELWKPIAKRQRIADVPGVHPVYLMEATVMKFGRLRQLL